MLQQSKNICLIIFIFSPFSTLTAQDSLYLIGTITGVSTEKNITNISRVGDVNGDGYDDFMIASRTGSTRKDQGIVQLYLGSPTLDLTPDVTFHYPCCDTLNYLGAASEIGDVNGDGYDDFAISGTFGDWGFVRGKVFIYYGGETIDTIPVTEFYENAVQDYFGGVVEELGDLNKDGYDDFSISSIYNWNNEIGNVYLFFGGDTISWQQCLTFSSDSLADFFGSSVANIGDLNLDGFNDIAIGKPCLGSNSNPGKVYIYFGSELIDVSPDTILGGRYIYEGFGSLTNNAGDLNNDNNIEYFIGGGAYIYLYSKMDLKIIINGFEMGIGGYINVSSNCDINNDGYDDFILGNTNYRNSDSLMVGGAFVYFGGKNIDTTYKIKLEGENKWGEYSKLMTSEDLNSDGFDELFVLSPKFPDFENPKGKVYIYSKINFTDIENSNLPTLNSFNLEQNFPNPFNPSTVIQYEISSRQFVQLKVYGVLGNEITTLVNEEKPAGQYQIQFNATSYHLCSGIYFCELKMKGGNKKYIKLVFIK